MSDYDDFQTKNRRLEILRALDVALNYTLDEITLRQQLGARGHAVSGDALRTDLAWLGEQKLIRARENDPLWDASLTGRGHDVSKGLAYVPGVARPQPEM